MDIFNTIFKNGSKTYYYSSIFFPPEIKTNVFILYSFVRTADNFVDAVPQDKKGFHHFKTAYLTARQGKPSGNVIIDSFVEIEKKYCFDPSWSTYFLAAMELDLSKQEYNTLGELECYMEGSAEVVGLMMAAILGLPKEAYPGAKLLGKAMQYINFIRDIAEDNALGRVYIPKEELQQFQLPSLQQEDSITHQEQFCRCIRQQLAQYRSWQKQAETYFPIIPKRFRIPIKTASDMYVYTANVIEQDPLVVYQKKVKPSIGRILFQGIINSLT